MARGPWLGAAGAFAAIVAEWWATKPDGPPPSSPSTETARVAGYEVVAEYPHDPGAFTQGLTYRDGFLYESTGASTPRKVQLETGEVVERRSSSRACSAKGSPNGTAASSSWTPMRVEVSVPAAFAKMNDPATARKELERKFGYAPAPSTTSGRSTRWARSPSKTDGG